MATTQTTHAPRGAHAGAQVEHRGTGTTATVRGVERWPDGRVRCVWVVCADDYDHASDIAIGCWRRFWRPVR